MSDLMYATLFDRGYLLRGTAMIQSLINHQAGARVTVLALDWDSRQFLRDRFANDNVTVLQLDDLPKDTVWNARQTRIYRDFCWTLSSVLCNHLLVDCEEVVYLDADIFFFSDPQELIATCRTGEVAAVPHGYPDRLRSKEVNGIFNVQWVYFRGPEGRAACQRWSEQCLDRCDIDLAAGVVGDQLYLDEWPSRYSTFVSLDHMGAGVAPWNHEIREPQKISGTWKVNGDVPVIFYHFQGMQITLSGKVKLSGPIYSYRKLLPEDLYLDYLEHLKVEWDAAQFLIPEPPPSSWVITKRWRWIVVLARLGTAVVRKRPNKRIRT